MIAAADKEKDQKRGQRERPEERTETKKVNQKGIMK